ncbi:general secretion pathway protein L [Luteimonas cucumeris]|uniref:General secretion pathway protein L n=1 Tax=Luteimonas cucumeris TaxID=985012 RepID=A0A562LBN2_9GAMM|nr:PilN domain-containing protein [Luteimonas cucumeris]TWI05053.1 general secretion pathway protein L [Luteimonas cucumeris]
MSALRDSFGRFGARLGPGAGGFFVWWGTALASWLPASWRAVFGLARERLLLARDGDALQLRVQTLDGLRDLGRVPWPAGAEADDPLSRLLAPSVAELPRWVLLPAGAGLRRRVLLPAAAGDRLRDVMAFEIDRQTPFPADAVYFDARVLERRGDGQIQAELVAVPKATLDTVLAGLGAPAATLTGVDIGDENSLPLQVNLLPMERRRRVADPSRRWNWILAALILSALAAGLWQILDNRRAAAQAFEREVSARADDARRVAQQRQQLLDLVEGAAFLERSRAGRPTAIAVIDDLSRRLPDGTYLEKLSMEGGKLQLIGFSTEVPQLVQHLEGSKLWHSSALAGAVQQDPRTGRDRFTLTADLAIAADPAKPAAAEPGDADAQPAR